MRNRNLIERIDKAVMIDARNKNVVIITGYGFEQLDKLFTIIKLRYV